MVLSGFRDLSGNHLRRRLRNRRRLSRSVSAKADRREGRNHDLAADPLLLQHPQPRSADTGAVAADLDADRSAMQTCRRTQGRSRAAATSNTIGSAPTTRGATCSTRIIYGFRISVLFGLILTVVSSVIGIAAGAVQGYFGGWIDLLFQRLIEIWTSVPPLYLLLIISSMLVPGFFVLARDPAAVLLGLAGRAGARRVPARAQFRVRPGRARARRVQPVIMFRHLLPNAMVATITFLPFIVSSSVMQLDRARFPRLWPAAGIAVARRIAVAGQGQHPGAVARHHRLLHRCDHALAADLHRRSGARCVRSAQGVRVICDGRHHPSPALRARSLGCVPARRPRDAGGRPRVVRSRQGRNARAGRRIRVRASR